MQDYEENDHYRNEDELMDLVQMAPLVDNFERSKDGMSVRKLAENYGEREARV